MHVGYTGQFDRLHAQPDPLLHLCSNRSILVACRGRFNALTEIHNAYRLFVGGGGGGGGGLVVVF